MPYVVTTQSFFMTQSNDLDDVKHLCNFDKSQSVLSSVENIALTGGSFLAIAKVGSLSASIWTVPSVNTSVAWT